MIRILKSLLIFFGFACVTGCPPPDTINIILDNGETSDIRLVDSNYSITLDDIHPFLSKRQKNIILNADIINRTKDTLVLICSKSMIYSKTDTFTWQNIKDQFSGIYSEGYDTVALVPNDLSRLHILFAGKKKYSIRSFRRTNRKDTLYLQLNLFDKYKIELPMRNHHRGAIWNTY